MKHKITLVWQVMSNQHIYGQKWKMKYMKSDAKQLKMVWQILAKRQWHEVPISKNVKLDITYYHKDKVRRDIDNYWKIVLDSLTGIVYEDDVQITEMKLTKKIDKENPRVEIIIIR